jgi:hypothetical protein
LESIPYLTRISLPAINTVAGITVTHCTDSAFQSCILSGISVRCSAACVTPVPT